MRRPLVFFFCIFGVHWCIKHGQKMHLAKFHKFLPFIHLLKMIKFQSIIGCPMFFFTSISGPFLRGGGTKGILPVHVKDLSVSGNRQPVLHLRGGRERVGKVLMGHVHLPIFRAACHYKFVTQSLRFCRCCWDWQCRLRWNCRWHSYYLCHSHRRLYLWLHYELVPIRTFVTVFAVS